MSGFQVNAGTVSTSGIILTALLSNWSQHTYVRPIMGLVPITSCVREVTNRLRYPWVVPPTDSWLNSTVTSGGFLLRFIRSIILQIQFGKVCKGSLDHF